MADVVQENRKLKLKGPLDPKKMILVRADISEGLSKLTETDIQFVSPDHDLKLKEIVGQKMSLEIEDEAESIRYWHGHCVSCAYEGKLGSQALFRAEVRPWFWFLTLHADCRIFQEQSALDVIKLIFGDRGFSDFQDKTSSNFLAREFLVQYRETDYEFICRLMEEEGMYFYFTHDNSKETLVIADGAGSHSALTSAANIEFHFREKEYKREMDHIYEWKSSERVNTGKVSLTDYDFTKPTTSLNTNTTIAKGQHNHKDIEVYDYPGIHVTADDGKTRTRIRAEAYAAEYKRTWGKCNVRRMAAGGTFRLKEHPRSDLNKEYLVLSANHKLQIETDQDKEGATSNRDGVNDNLNNKDSNKKESYESEFSVQLKNEPFRAPLKTSKPIIAGLQTAMVTGPSGEEIYTDKYGRIKVQFHWDRVGQKDENTTCFIRVSQSLSGQGWGAFHIPRIGQEVVVQFEEGNPDRPIVTGMLFHETKKHPFEFPANKTQHGMKTNSTKGGGGFHELVFEDKKDEEFVRFQSEKDYMAIIKNNAEISIGFEKTDPGNFTQKIYANKVEEIETGDHTFTIKAGSEINTIETDRTSTINNDENVTIANNKTDGIGADYKINVGANLEIEAGTSIKLTVGSTVFELTSSGATLTSSAVEITASGTVDVTAGGALDVAAGGAATIESSGAMTVKSSGIATFEAGGMATVKSGGILTVQGSVVKIN